MTQKERVLNELTWRHSVCSTRFLEAHIPRAAARIAELRAEGYLIVTETCNDPYHNHKTRQVQYRLQQPEQTVFFSDDVIKVVHG